MKPAMTAGIDVPAVDGPALAAPGTDAPADAPATDGGGSDVKDALDLTDVMPPTMLTATVSNRREGVFQLVWTAPSNAGQGVSGYKVRYARVPITVANFDDTTMTAAVPYTGTPSVPGAADGLLVKLYIENSYYFAVTGTDASGAHVGALMTTTSGGRRPLQRHADRFTRRNEPGIRGHARRFAGRQRRRHLGPARRHGRRQPRVPVPGGR